MEEQHEKVPLLHNLKSQRTIAHVEQLGFPNTWVGKHKQDELLEK